MSEKLLVLTSLIAVATGASAGISAGVFPYSSGTLSTGEAYVSFELQVTVTGDDAWTVAGGPQVGEPWIIVTGGTFYHDPVNDTNPPNPAFFEYFPDSEFTSFYTTHLGYPNIEGTSPGVSPGFASGPADTPTALNADWYWTPNGNDYPGTFTIARITIIPDGPNYCVDLDMLIGSIDVPPFRFIGSMIGCCPGDLDGNGNVDLGDLTELLANYGTTSGATYWDGDMDGDDDVDLHDLAELLSLYGTDCYPVP